MKSFSIAVVQLRVEDNKEANIASARARIEDAARAGADLIVLPEMFCCPYDHSMFRPFSEPVPEGPVGQFLQQTSARLGVHIVGGSIPEREGDRIYNTSTLWSPQGELLLTHRKVHLFDVDIPGGITFFESESLAAGDSIKTVETDLGRIGVAICYDLRFPEVFRKMVLDGAELIVLPGAFNATTGPAHWAPLIRARAIENTCFVAACAPAPTSVGSYPGWGHSMVVDPYGRVLAEAEDREATITAAIDADRLDEVRRALPVLEQRRPDAYG